jgi:hypothetical protein
MTKSNLAPNIIQFRQSVDQRFSEQRFRGLDFSLPPDVWSMLSTALTEDGFEATLEDTAPNLLSNIRFHKVSGVSKSGRRGAIGIFFLSDERLSKCPDTYFAYSLCIRILKYLRTPNVDTVSLVAMATDGTNMPSLFEKQMSDFCDIRAVATSQVQLIPGPEDWTDAKLAKQYACEWLAKAELTGLQDPGGLAQARDSPLDITAVPRIAAEQGMDRKNAGATADQIRVQTKGGVVVKAHRAARKMEGKTISQVLDLAERAGWKVDLSDDERAQLAQASPQR